MRITDYYYIYYKEKAYPIVGISLDREERHELRDEPCDYLLFGDEPLARVLEPFDTLDKENIDNQIIYYFDNDVCHRFIKGALSKYELFKIVKETMLSW